MIELKVRDDLLVRCHKKFNTFYLVQKYENREIVQEINRFVAYMVLDFPKKIELYNFLHN